MFSPRDEVVDSTIPIEITWQDVGAGAYIVEIEQDDLGFKSLFQVSGATTSISFPANILEKGLDYEIGVSAIGESGNAIVTEGEFTTAE